MNTSKSTSCVPVERRPLNMADEVRRAVKHDHNYTLRLTLELCIGSSLPLSRDRVKKSCRPYEDNVASSVSPLCQRVSPPKKVKSTKSKKVQTAPKRKQSSVAVGNNRKKRKALSPEIVEIETTFQKRSENLMGAQAENSEIPLSTPHYKDTKDHAVSEKNEVSCSKADKMQQLEAISRYTLNFAVSDKDQSQKEDVISMAQRATREIQPPPPENDRRTGLKIRRARAIEPRLNTDDYLRIRELFPPANYIPPRLKKQNRHLIERSKYSNDLIGRPRYMQPMVTKPDVMYETWRCPSNYNTERNHHLATDSAAHGSEFSTQSGSYYGPDVDYLPVPNSRTPRYALMNTAPSICSSGFYVAPERKSADDIEPLSADNMCPGTKSGI